MKPSKLIAYLDKLMRRNFNDENVYKDNKENRSALSGVEKKEKRNLVFPSCSGLGSMYSCLKGELHSDLSIYACTYKNSRNNTPQHLLLLCKTVHSILVSMRHDNCQNNQRFQMTQHLSQSNNDITTVLSLILQITQYEIQNESHHPHPDRKHLFSLEDTQPQYLVTPR